MFLLDLEIIFAIVLLLFFCPNIGLVISVIILCFSLFPNFQKEQEQIQLIIITTFFLTFALLSQWL